MGISSRRLSLAVLFLLTHAIAMMTSAEEPIYLRPTDDATVVESHPNTNYGADPTLQVDLQDSEGGEEWSYLKFVIGSVAGNIGRARLRLEVVAPSSNTADVYKTLNTSWNEETITWSHSTRPGLSTFVTSIGSTTMNQVIYMDVTNHVAPNSVVTFALKPRSIYTANFASKEHATARRPSLILDNISACIPPSSTPTAFNYCSTASPLLLQTQSPTDVSIQMSAASGVTITQLTDNVANMIPYYDIPAVVAGSNRFVYSAAPPSGTLYTATMRLDGTDEKLLTSSPESSTQTFLTPDGSMAYFPRQNLSTNRMDIKAVNLHGTTCAESTIAQNFLLPEGGGMTQLSPASRSCAINKWVIAVATRERVFRYKGKGADPSTLWASMGDYVVGQNDENGDKYWDQPFHGIRLSPTCPNILMYSRNRPVAEGGAGDKNVFLVDLDRDWTRPFYLAWGADALSELDPVFLARFPDGKRRFPSHQMWSNDGLQVGYTLATGPWDNILREWVIGNILNPDCTFRTTNPDGTSNVEGTSGIAARTFKGTAITNSTGALYSEVPKFCSWSADDQHFACSGYQLAASDTEGQSAIFLLNRSTGARRWLTMTHEVPDDGDGDYYPGQSHLQFAGNKTTILFDSDRRIGMNNWAQVYKATYPSSMLP